MSGSINKQTTENAFEKSWATKQLRGLHHGVLLQFDFEVDLYKKNYEPNGINHVLLIMKVA